MPSSKSFLSFALLSLFTSAERSGSIQGDLLEEAQSRGRVWFWSQVIRTTGALCWQGFAGSPLPILKVMLFGGVAWFVVTLVVMAGDSAVEFLFRSVGVSIHIRAVWDFLLAGLLTGIILGRAAPMRGMYASVALAFASVPVLALLFNFRAIPAAGLADFRLTALALSEALLLLGAALSRLRTVHSG